MWMIVVFVAVGALSACGVESPELDGQEPVGVGQQAVYVTPDGNIVAYSAQTTATPSVPNGGTNALPQDPVPVHNGSPNVVVVLPTSTPSTRTR
jgi:hypothetical protein